MFIPNALIQPIHFLIWGQRFISLKLYLSLRSFEKVTSFCGKLKCMGKPHWSGGYVKKAVTQAAALDSHRQVLNINQLSSTTTTWKSMSSIPHICLTCQNVFSTLGFLGLHCTFLRHTPNPFCCIPCGLSFADRTNLAQALYFLFHH